MATVPLFSYQTKSQPEIRDDILRTLANHLRSLGIANPNVSPNSDYYGIATGLANEICVGLANNVIAVDQIMPDTAGGVSLDRWMALFNLSRNPALGSSGLVTPTYSTGSTFVVSGSQLTDSAGLRYGVTIGGTYGTNAGLTPQIPVAAIDIGKATNHANGDTLTWVAAPPFVDLNVKVGTTGGSDGLEGGADSEVGVDDPPRARLIATLQSPPRGGNASDIAFWAGKSTPEVQVTFVYPALLGPSTVAFAVSQAPQQTPPFASNSKTRAVPAALITGTILPYVRGLVPENVLVIGTSTTDQPSDISFILSLPSAPTASPAGPGGGWADGTPWPSSVSGNPVVVHVTPTPTSTVFTVNATTPPTPGVSHIAWVSPLNWTLYTAIVTGFTGSSGSYAITIDTPWPGIAAGNHIFPQSVNQQNYLSAVLASFANLGAGEWTTNATLTVRAFRHPIPSLSWPNGIDSRALRNLENAGPEVRSARVLFDASGGAPNIPVYPTLTAAPGYLLTSTATMSPFILTPANISWYAQ